MRRAPAVALLLLALAQPAWSECQCLWRGSFVDVNADTDLVIAGTVVAGKGNSIDVRVDRLLRGDEQAVPVRVWLQAEQDPCRPEATGFAVDSEWVMALQRIDEVPPGGFNPSTPNVSYGRAGDYVLSSCGGYWLSRTGDWVTGNLVDAPRWEREPQMSPVLLDLVAGQVSGSVDTETLLRASREDPALKELMLDTRAFLRKEN